MTEHRSQPEAGTSLPGLPRTVLLAVVAAAGAALVVHGLFDAFGADYVVQPPGQAQSTVTPGLAAGVAGFAAAVGTGLTALLAPRSARPRRVVVVLALVGLVLLAPTPLLAADQGLTVLALEVMHLAVAGAFVAVVLSALSPTSSLSEGGPTVIGERRTAAPEGDA